MSDEANSRRLFFALRPDAAQRKILADWAARLPARAGRRVPAVNIHLTLAFLGSTGPERQACFEQAAQTVCLQPFELVVDRVGHFARARVLWAGPTHTPPELAALVRDLNAALTACGYTPESRPFHPHVTLLRKARPPQADPDPPRCRWWVEGFCLMVSAPDAGGVRYRVLREYPAC